MYNVDTMKYTIGGKMAQGVPFLPQSRGKMVQFPFSPYISRI